MIGGTLPLLGSGYRVGQGDTIILESCEYCNSFLSFFPTVAVILNVEADHLDFFKDLEDIEHSFRRLCRAGARRRAPSSPTPDDASAMDAVAGLARPVFTFGLDKAADCTAAEPHLEQDGCPAFDVVIHGERLRPCEAAGPRPPQRAATPWPPPPPPMFWACPAAPWRRAWPPSRGAGRRFEYKGSFHGAEVYDDYAHHPDELHALLDHRPGSGLSADHRAPSSPTPTPAPPSCSTDFVEELKLPGRGHPGGDLRRPGAEHPGHLLRRPVPERSPARVYCSTLDKVTERPAAAGPARGPDPDRGRRGHLPGGRKAAGNWRKTREHFSPVFTTARPEGELLPQEAGGLRRCWSSLDIPYDRVSRRPRRRHGEVRGRSAQVLGSPICKNLFLCNRQKTAVLPPLHAGPDKPFQTKDLSAQIGSARLSFAPEDKLWELLHCTPGSATILGLMNDTEHRVRLLMDRAVYEAEYLSLPPLHLHQQPEAADPRCPHEAPPPHRPHAPDRGPAGHH